MNWSTAATALILQGPFLEFRVGFDPTCRTTDTEKTSRSGGSFQPDKVRCQESGQIFCLHFGLKKKNQPSLGPFGALFFGLLWPSWAPPQWWKGKPESHRSTPGLCQPRQSSRTCWPRDPWRWSPESPHTLAPHVAAWSWVSEKYLPKRLWTKMWLHGKDLGKLRRRYYNLVPKSEIRRVVSLALWYLT